MTAVAWDLLPKSKIWTDPQFGLRITMKKSSYKEHRVDALAPYAEKDVASCEKLRGAASRRRSVDIRMGEPGR